MSGQRDIAAGWTPYKPGQRSGAWVTVKSSPTRDEFDYAQLDPGIATAVRVLRKAGVETVWSCEGGEGHSSMSP